DSIRPSTGTRTPPMTSHDANARTLRASDDRSSIVFDNTRLTVENAIMPNAKVIEYASTSLITTATSHNLYLRIETANASGISASGRIEIVEEIGFTDPTTNQGTM